MNPIRVVLLILLSQTLSTAEARADICNEIPAPSGTTRYEEVLNRIFPLIVTVPFRDNVQQVISLRYLDSDDLEVFIRVYIADDNSAQAVLLLPDGGSVRQQVARVCANACPEITRIAAGVDLRERRLSSVESVGLRQLVREFHKLRIPVQLEPHVYLDAPRYDTGISSAMNSLTVSLYGPGLQSKRPHALIKWAEKLRAIVISATASQNGKKIPQSAPDNGAHPPE